MLWIINEDVELLKYLKIKPWKLKTDKIFAWKYGETSISKLRLKSYILYKREGRLESLYFMHMEIVLSFPTFC